MYRHDRFNPGSSQAMMQFFKDNLVKLRELRKLVVSPAGTEIRDINGNAIVFEGLTYGDPALEDLLKVNYVFFERETLHNPEATQGGIKEFSLGARYPWGHDRIL